MVYFAGVYRFPSRRTLAHRFSRLDTKACRHEGGNDVHPMDVVPIVCCFGTPTIRKILDMWWCMTDDCLQRLRQSRGETSSTLTDDGLDDGGSF